MMEGIGYKVVKLHRFEFMGIHLTGLRGPGDWAYLDEDEMKLIEDAAALLLYQQAEENDITYEADSFVLMLVLRERWPVGSKAKLRDIAARAGAVFSYKLVVCPPQPFTDGSDDEAVAKAEAASLAEMLPTLKRARKQFASSSGLQQFLNNA